jgi:hypothetical protein
MAVRTWSDSSKRMGSVGRPDHDPATHTTDGRGENANALRSHLLATGTFDAPSLGKLRGDRDIASTIKWVEEQNGGVLVLHVGGTPAYPAFQFTTHGGVRPEIEPHIRTLQHAGLGAWQTWAWLATPAGLLSGEVPAQILVTDPARGTAAVHRLASRVRRPVA